LKERNDDRMGIKWERHTVERREEDKYIKGI
jgi:hypothetical protein